MRCPRFTSAATSSATASRSIPSLPPTFTTITFEIPSRRINHRAHREHREDKKGWNHGWTRTNTDEKAGIFGGFHCALPTLQAAQTSLRYPALLHRALLSV